jgi:CRISPR-associated protein Cmr6
MSRANLGWLFYKKYYSAIDFTEGGTDTEKLNKEKFETINNIIIQRQYSSEKNNFSLIQSSASQPFDRLKVSYPGLITGTGYTHQTGKLGEFKIGFYFDHCTGLPVLPGHSVKGALRANFPKYKSRDKVNFQEAKAETIIRFLENSDYGCGINASQKYHDYLHSINVIKDQPGFDNEVFITLLENNIFEGSVPEVDKGIWKKDSKGNLLFRPMGIYERDLFFEAYPVSGDSKGLLLATDSITPHTKPLENPNPILFLKLRSGIHLQFQFNCKDGIISAEHKLKLFRHLLLGNGVGAKTNVGYGQFEEQQLL